MKHDLIVSEIVRYAWDKVMANMAKIIWACIAYLVLQALLAGGSGFFKPYGLFLMVGSWAASAIFNLCSMQICLKVTKNQDFQPEDFWTFNMETLLEYIKMLIIRFFIVFGGYLLFLIPGCVWTYKYMFASYLVVEKKMTVSQALEESGRITYGYKWTLGGFSLVYMILNLVGALCLGVGLFVTIPMTWVMQTYIYRKLSSSLPEQIQSH